MFSTLIVWYLFLGGAAAGGVGILCFADLAWSRGTCRTAACGPAAPVRRSFSEFLGRGHLVCSVGLAACSCCLVMDLGNPRRFLYVFVHPTLSALTVGSYAIATTLACSALLAAFALLKIRVPHRTIACVEVLGLLAGVVMVVYTGVLLTQMHDSVILWNAMVVPLFACSSASAAAAVLLACLVPLDQAYKKFVRCLSRFDITAVLLEIVFFALFVVVARSQAPELLVSLLAGPGWWRVWVGFAGCGLLAPLALGTANAKCGDSAFVAASIPLVLAGSFFLRYFMVNVPVV